MKAAVVLTSDSDLRALRVFRAVVEHRSFLGAQVALGLSQSAVSFHIKALEDRLGFKLCRRGRGGFELTDRGAVVYERSKALALSLSEFETHVARLRNRVTGVMRLGIVDNTITDEELPIARIISTLKTRAPDAQLHLKIDAPEVLLAELGTGGVDLAILPETRSYGGLRFTPLKIERHLLYCAAHHPVLATGSPPAVEAIAQQAFVVRAYANLDELGIFPHATAGAKVSNMEAQAMFILSGCYIGFLPVHYARRWVDTGRLVVLRPDLFSLASRFFIATRTGKPQPPLAELFVQHLVSLASERLHRAETERVLEPALDHNENM